MFVKLKEKIDNSMDIEVSEVLDSLLRFVFGTRVEENK